VNDTAIDNGAGGLQLAQSFLVTGTAGGTRGITSVALPLYDNGAFGGGTATLTIRQDNGAGFPGTIVANSTVLLALNTGLTSTTPSLITFTFTDVLNLSVGSTYWIVLDGSYGQEASPVIKWAADDGNVNANAYSSGKAEYQYDGTAGPNGQFGTGTALGGLRELGFSINCN
jgi:hypothetical protein